MNLIKKFKRWRAWRKYYGKSRKAMKKGARLFIKSGGWKKWDKATKQAREFQEKLTEVVGENGRNKG